MTVELITERTFFAGDPDSLDTDSIAVTWRGGDRYAVKRRSQDVWDGKEWVYEPQPSSRTDEFKARTRFGYQEACRIADALISVAARSGVSSQ